MNFRYHNVNIHCMETPGSRLRALRKKKGLSQVQLSDMVSVDQSTVSDIENGGGLSAEYMMRLCEALGTTPQYVMRGKSDADDLLMQIKQLVITSTHNHVGGEAPVSGAPKTAQDGSASGKPKVSLVSSQQEPRIPKGANLGTFGEAPAKPKGKHAGNKTDRVRKQRHN